MSRLLKLAALGAVLIVAVVVIRFATGSGGGESDDKPGLAGEGRTTFVQAANEACLKAQTGAAENATLTPAAIARFCGCYGATLADAMSPADVERLSRLAPDQIVAAQEDKADEAFQACSETADEDAK